MYHEEAFASAPRFKDLFRINFKHFRNIDEYLDEKKKIIFIRYIWYNVIII